MTTTKEALLLAGMDLFLRHSYQGTGIADILAQAGVPKGSFYHYFPSKEAFALAVIAMHREKVAQIIEQTLRNPDLPHMDRIRNYLGAMTTRVISSKYTQGCPVGTFAQEMAASSEVLRVAIEKAFRAGIECLRACIAEGQSCGAIRCDLPPEATARYIHSAMHGAMIVAKAERDRISLDALLAVTVECLLPPA